MAEKTTSYISSAIKITHHCEWEANNYTSQSYIWALSSAFYVLKEVVFYDFMLMWLFDKTGGDS